MSDFDMQKAISDYNTLGNTLVEMGGKFTPRSSFRDQFEAESLTSRLQDTIESRKNGIETVKREANDPAEKESKMTTAATHTNGAKKAPAKKAAAKKATVAKKAKAKVAKERSPYGKFNPDGKIHIVEKENPRRAGTDRHKFYEIARKSATVAAYVKSGGHIPSLKKCVDKGWIKVTG